MSRNKAALVIKKMVQKIVAETKPEKVILFGSYAWGSPDIGSDVDLFIIKSSHKPAHDRILEIERLIYPTTLPTDVLVYTPEEVNRRVALGDFFVKRILTDGKVFYDEQKS